MTKLIPFADAEAQLSWFHPVEEKREYVLRSTGGDVAVLRWEKESGTLARGESSSGQWTFKRVGFFQPQITARAHNSTEDFAKFEPGSAGGGVVHLSNGHIFRWSSNVWRGEWSWVNAAGERGIRFRRDFAMDRREGTVEITPKALPDREVPLLVLLGWYLIILFAEDAALA
jgi:hypothetical protein